LGEVWNIVTMIEVLRLALSVLLFDTVIESVSLVF